MIITAALLMRKLVHITPAEMIGYNIITSLIRGITTILVETMVAIVAATANH